MKKMRLKILTAARSTTLTRALSTTLATALLLLLLPNLANSLSGDDKARLLKSLNHTIGEQYVMIENIGQIERSLSILADSRDFQQLDDATAVAKTISGVLRQHDQHFTVQFSAPDKTAPKPKAGEGWFTKLDRKNAGFNKVEILDGNVGYIEFWGFAELTAKSRARAEAVMLMVADTEALIFDLRSNGGGSAAMDQLLSSYLFDGKTQLNSIYSRPTNTTTEYWTNDNISGTKRPNTPVYLLTSKDTYSAAEAFAYSLKHLERATVIGETTKGGANPWQFFPLVDGFRAGIPVAKAVNPVTNSNWEGSGVIPDIQTSREDAFDVAYKMALTEVKSRAIDPWEPALSN